MGFFVEVSAVYRGLDERELGNQHMSRLFGSMGFSGFFPKGEIIKHL